MAATRRSTLLGLAALLSVGWATGAAAKTKSFPATKLFPYLDLYLGIPAPQRTLFVLAYFLKLNGKPAASMQPVLIVGGSRTVLPVGADGRVQRLPSLADLKAKTQIELSAPEGSKFSLNMEMLARVTPATAIPAGQLVAAIDQCDRAIRSKAGLLGFAAPKIKRAVFKGAGSGTAVNAQGVARPLPLTAEGSPAFDPEQMPGTVTIKLARAPTSIALAGRPKT